MPEPHLDPPAAVAFLPIVSATKTRIFLLHPAERAGAVPSLTQVTTVNGPPEVARTLVAALNAAARAGDHAQLGAVLDDLPEAVGHACRAALAACPDPATMLVGVNGDPMTALRRASFSYPFQDLAHQASAAMDVGLQYLIVNRLDDEGRVELEATLMSDEVELLPDELAGWWPVPVGKSIATRERPSPDDVAELFRDPRWETYEARAYWVWVKDSADEDEYGATAEWVVEFFDQPLDPESNLRVFIPDNLDEDQRGFVSPRNRFLLWLALWNMSSDLDQLVMDWGDGQDSIVKDDMPALVRSQPREWWRQMHRSAVRLCEAARRGALHELVPRTPAEEALVHLATQRGYLDWAEDLMNDMDLNEVYARLPITEVDGEWEEILGDLTGDVDIEIAWMPGLAHRADPNDQVNRAMGIGDYRPQAWHRLFDRAVGGLTEGEL